MPFELVELRINSVWINRCRPVLCAEKYMKIWTDGGSVMSPKSTIATLTLNEEKTQITQTIEKHLEFLLIMWQISHAH